MRNLIFYTMIFTLVFTTSSCSQTMTQPAEETLEISLPVWPPDGSYTDHYPPLSRWYIQITGAGFQESFYSAQSQISVQIKKNRPLCITAKPITLLYDGSESDYFKPAGYMYPFSEDSSSNTTPTLNWEQGYLANLMQKLFKRCNTEGLSQIDTEYLISTFNWTKAQTSIEQKIHTDSEIFYNPWLIPEAPVLEAVSSHSFKSSLLTPAGILSITTNQLKNSFITSDSPLLSSFIPENFCIEQKNQFTVMKNSPIIIGDGNKYALYITCKSAKNISLELIYLPIYIEDI